MSTEIVALSIAAMALILSLLVFYRSRGKYDHRARDGAVSNKIHGLGANAKQANGSRLATVSDRYQRQLRMIGDLHSRIAELKAEALEEIRADLGNIANKLERLAARVRHELRDLKSGLDWTILEMEIGLRLTLDDAKAHLKLIEAKRELLLARRSALRNDLIEARARVEAALTLIDEAQSLALGHHDNLVALRRQTQAMLATIGKEAAATQASIDALLERSNRILDQMNESETATKAPPESRGGEIFRQGARGGPIRCRRQATKRDIYGRIS